MDNRELTAEEKAYWEQWVKDLNERQVQREIERIRMNAEVHAAFASAFRSLEDARMRILYPPTLWQRLKAWWVK